MPQGETTYPAFLYDGSGPRCTCWKQFHESKVLCGLPLGHLGDHRRGRSRWANDLDLIEEDRLRWLEERP